jgi:hypothetical protein
MSEAEMVVGRKVGSNSDSRRRRYVYRARGNRFHLVWRAERCNLSGKEKMILAIMEGRASVDQKSLPATSADGGGKKEKKKTEGTHGLKFHLLKAPAFGSTEQWENPK